MIRSTSGLSLLAAVLSALAILVVAPPCAAADGLRVENPWARASVGTARPTAAYLTIHNLGRNDDVLIGVETPVAGMAEVHKIETKDGIASMGPAGPVAVPAGASVRLAPGGLHAMLMSLKRPLKEGSAFSLTLVFEKAGRIEVSVPVQGIGAKGPPQ